jgi:hypothetical protein
MRKINVYSIFIMEEKAVKPSENSSQAAEKKVALSDMRR